MMSSRFLACFLALLVFHSVARGADRNPDLFNERPQKSKPRSGHSKFKMFPYSELIVRTISLLAGQEYAVDEEISSKFERFALEDDSNDSVGRASTQELILRSGFNYENHYVVSSDGYVTQLVRIVNPLADRAHLKQPPVAMYHGGVTDTSLWVANSAIQHHPEKYPRSEGDKHITSWNRSLGFVLANNGYDVWLVSTRGSNKFNKGHIKHGSSGLDVGSQTVPNDSKVSDTIVVNSTDVDPKQLEEFFKSTVDLKKTIKYWDYTMDEIGALEIPAQVEKILEITGANNITMVTLSLSSMTSIIALAANPSLERKLHNLVVIGPIVNNRGTNNFVRLYHHTLCRGLPDELGNVLYPELILSQASRDLLLHINKKRELRFLFTRIFELLIGGPSPKYQTHLEQPAIGHLFMPTSYKELKHYCQQVIAGQLQKFDHGLIRNKFVYGSIFPPRYNVANIKMPNWLVVSGGFDALATPKSVQQYINMFERPPFKHIAIKSYNHIDLICAVDIDLRIHLPILEYLDRFQLRPLNEHDVHQLLTRSLASAAGKLEQHVLLAGSNEALLADHADQSYLQRRHDDSELSSSSSALLEGHMKRSLDHAATTQAPQTSSHA